MLKGSVIQTLLPGWRGACAAAAVLFAICSGGPAHAQSQSANADALFSEGHAAMESHDFATACQKFRESDRLDPAIGTKLNLGICEEKRGKLATAWDLYRRVVDEAEPSDERRALAQELAEKVQPRVPKITIRLAPNAPRDTSVQEGALVLRGASVGVAVPLDPGKHQLVARAPGYSDRVLIVDLTEGQRRTIEVEPGPAVREGLAPVPVGGVAANVVREPKSVWSKPPFLILAGVGVAGVAIGAVTGVAALGKKNTADANCNDVQRWCTPEGHDADAAGRSLMTASTVGWVVGGLGLAGAGAYFLLSAKSSEHNALAVRASVSGSAANATVGGTW
ncbi:MAG TPA: hypothetical protein VHE30_11095 [Polyangiaceae bacterium]|nr:hypothetical protein [Polyangiaceae bacterium]